MTPFLAYSFIFKSSSNDDIRKIRSRERGKAMKRGETMFSKKKLMSAKLMVRLMM